MKLSKDLFLAGTKFAGPIKGSEFKFIAHNGLPKGNPGYIAEHGPMLAKGWHWRCDVLEITPTGFKTGVFVINDSVTKTFKYAEFSISDK